VNNLALAMALALLGLGLVGGLAWLARKIAQRRCRHWLKPYLRWTWQQRRRPRPTGPIHLLFLFVDHFEPQRGQAAREQEEARMRAWLERYPRLAERFRDADGRPPQHTWFYPLDEYRAENLQALAGLCFEGWGEIELHLHHDRDTPENFRRMLRDALEKYAQAGALLTAEAEPRSVFGFIHGMYALDNARPDGRYCGVNNELQILREEGCYADFTLPTPDETQPRLLNTIYYAADDPHRPKSHDDGRPVAVGQAPGGDLLLVPGPLGINLRDWRHRFYPAIEDTNVTALNPPLPRRVDFWVRTGIHVAGRPEWVFVKIYTHGAVERDFDTLLGEPAAALHEYLARRYNDGERFVLHYVTAREAYNIIKAAEAGHMGDPGLYRDYLLPPYANRRLRVNRPYRLHTYSPTAVELTVLEEGEVNVEFQEGPLRTVRGTFERLRWKPTEQRLTFQGPGPIILEPSSSRPDNTFWTGGRTTRGRCPAVARWPGEGPT